MIDYTQQLQDRAIAQDLQLEIKQDLALEKMKQKIAEIDKSGKLKEISYKKKDKGIDR